MSFFTNRRQSETEAEKQQVKPTIPQHPVGFETVLGTGSVMEGTLSSKGNVRLDGDFKGTLDISGNVLVGETAKINADIDARNISIAGAVRGNITGKAVKVNPNNGAVERGIPLADKAGDGPGEDIP